MTANLRETEALLDRFTPWRGMVPAGYHANFLGSMTPVLFLAHWYPKELIEAALAGPRHVETARPRVIDGEPYFEWCNVIRSVVQARGRYVMVELGGGYGARAVDCAVALRRLNPVPSFLVVLEALPTYVDWAEHHFRANGLSPQDHWLLNAIVSERPVPECMYLQPRGFGNQVNDGSIGELLERTLRNEGTALAFARALVEAGGARIEDGRVVPDAERRRRRAFVEPASWTAEQMQAEAVVGQDSAQLGFVSALTLSDVLRPLDRVDFMDVDIQFAEIKVIPPSLEVLGRKVKLLSIGTHSGDIHDRLRSAFDPATWEVLTDFTPWSAHETSLGRFQTQDGILTVLNKKLDNRGAQ
jgi:hypothetical protein